MSKKILLTGGAGFIGSHTYVALQEAGYDVTILDNFENSQRDIPDRLAKITGAASTVIDCDIRDNTALHKVFAEEPYDAVVHFAARKSVGDSENDPVGYYRSNVSGLINVVSAMQAHNLRSMVFSSSASVYGDTDQVPITEDTAPNPTSVYARTKIVGEHLLNAAAAAAPGLAIGTLRYFNPVGAHQSGLIGEDPSQPPSNLVPIIARVARGDLEALNIYGNDYPTADGFGVRDYIHISDLARGHVLSLDAVLGQRQSHLVNLGSGQGHSVMEVLKTYENVVARTLPYNIVDRRPGDVAVSLADATLAKKVLGFQARHDLRAMCESDWAYSRG